MTECSLVFTHFYDWQNFNLYLKFTVVQYRKLNIFNILQTKGFSDEVRNYPVSVLWDKKSTIKQNHLFSQPKVLDQADTQYRLQGDLRLFWGFQFDRKRTEAWNLRQHLGIAQKWNIFFNNIFENSKSVATTLAFETEKPVCYWFDLVSNNNNMNSYRLVVKPTFSSKTPSFVRFEKSCCFCRILRIRKIRTQNRTLSVQVGHCQMAKTWIKRSMSFPPYWNMGGKLKKSWVQK